MKKNLITNLQPSILVCLILLAASLSTASAQEIEGILDPFCSPCKTLCEKTLKVIPAGTVKDMKCPAFGTIFSTTCEAISGGTGPEAAVLCFSGGIVASKVCEEIYGSPHQLIEDASGAAKHICKGIKLCR